MSEYKPRPLASYAKTTRLSDLENNLVTATVVVGGSCYSSGSPVGPFPGAIGKINLKVAPWIGNDRKTEPYSYLLVRARIPTVGAVSTHTVRIPVYDAIADAVGVSAEIRYESGGATFAGNVSYEICDSGITTVDFSSTPLTAQQYVTSSISAATWTTNPTKALNFIRFAVSNASGTTYNDFNLSMLFKTKHVA